MKNMYKIHCKKFLGLLLNIIYGRDGIMFYQKQITCIVHAILNSEPEKASFVAISPPLEEKWH